VDDETARSIAVACSQVTPVAVTFKETLIKHLTDNGMFPDQANAVFDQYSNDAGKPMAGRWNKPTASEPNTVLAVLILSINDEAVRWIDENLPKAWYRPMFAKDNPPQVEESDEVSKG
jgi:hypothetical protein